MDIIIDIDGTICKELPTFERGLAIPQLGAVESINKLYDSGETIIFYSSRGWSEYKMTKDWLDRFGFKYHQLLLGKPIGKVWIDDRAISHKDWSTTMNEFLKIKK